MRRPLRLLPSLLFLAFACFAARPAAAGRLVIAPQPDTTEGICLMSAKVEIDVPTDSIIPVRTTYAMRIKREEGENEREMEVRLIGSLGEEVPRQHVTVNLDGEWVGMVRTHADENHADADRIEPAFTRWEWVVRLPDAKPHNLTVSVYTDPDTVATPAPGRELAFNLYGLSQYEERPSSIPVHVHFHAAPAAGDVIGLPPGVRMKGGDAAWKYQRHAEHTRAFTLRWRGVDAKH